MQGTAVSSPVRSYDTLNVIQTILFLCIPACQWPYILLYFLACPIFPHIFSKNVSYVPYTEDAGLPFFDRAAVTENGYWYYTSALRPMRGNQSFHCHLANIGPIYT